MTVGRRVEDKSLGCSGGVPGASKGRFSAPRPMGDAYGILQESLVVESHNVKKVELNSKRIKPCGEIQGQVRMIKLQVRHGYRRMAASDDDEQR